MCHSHDECSHLSLHERMVGNRDARPELQKYKKIIINSLESVGMEGTREFGQPWLVQVNGGKE